jgi:hypothetical protein
MSEFNKLTGPGALPSAGQPPGVLDDSLLLLVCLTCMLLQELMLRSSRPLAALEMRQQLKHWPEALALAQRLAPDRVPALSKEHAARLELVGEHAEARQHYQQVRPSQNVWCASCARNPNIVPCSLML